MKIRLICVAFVILLVVIGWDTLVSESKKANDEYNLVLATARDQARLGINEKAYGSYSSALNIRESYELRCEMIDFLHEIKSYKTLEKEQKKLLELYPKEKKTYEYLCDYAIENNDINGLYTYKAQMEARGVHSDRIDELAFEHQNDYYLSKSGYLKMDPLYYGYARIYSENGYVGFIDSFGNQIIGANYLEAAPYTGIGMFIVKNKDNDTVYIDMAGEKVHVDPEMRKMVFDDIQGYSEDRIAVCENGRYRYIDYNYNDILANKDYEFASMYSQNRAAVKNDKGWILIDQNQNSLGNKVFEEIKLTENGVAVVGGRSVVKYGGMWYLADADGNFVTENTFEDMCCPFDFNGQQPIAAKKNGKWGYIDQSGNDITDFIYDDARSFNRGYAAIKRDGKWGIINLEGQTIAEPQFEMAYEMNSGGTIPVLTDAGWKMMIFYSKS